MALSGHKLPLRLAILLLKFHPFPPNPSYARNNSQPHSVIIKTQRSSHPHPTTWWIHTHMEIFDILADHLYRYPAYVDAMAFHLNSPVDSSLL